MSTGLLALLDDVVALARAAAVQVDDIATMSAKAATKSMGVVIDDAAVTPRYAVGVDPSRELPIIWRIAKGSLRNKLMILLPGALVLSLLAPWSITPILMLGGAYLCFEGAEKVLEATGLHHGHGAPPQGDTAQDHPVRADAAGTPAAREDRRVAGAVRTDLILSAEIMAITLAGLPVASFGQQAIVLAIVGIGITALVYGAVALIVKADDVGLAMAARQDAPAMVRALGRGIVKIMPGFLAALATVGTLAMLWVGGGILLHGLEALGAGGPMHAVHALALGIGDTLTLLDGAVSWLVTALLSAMTGLGVGLAILFLAARVVLPMAARLRLS